MIIGRPPRAALQPFVEVLWATEPSSEALVPAPRELILPTGAMHLVVLLSPRRLRLFADAHDPLGREVGHALVGGVREAPFVRDISSPPRSVGAMLRPGFAELVLGAPAAYRALHPSEPHHVALVPEGDPAVTRTSISSKTGATRPTYPPTSFTERGDKP